MLKSILITDAKVLLPMCKVLPISEMPDLYKRIPISSVRNGRNVFNFVKAEPPDCSFCLHVFPVLFLIMAFVIEAYENHILADEGKRPVNTSIDDVDSRLI